MSNRKDEKGRICKLALPGLFIKGFEDWILRDNFIVGGIAWLTETQVSSAGWRRREPEQENSCLVKMAALFQDFRRTN